MKKVSKPTAGGVEHRPPPPPPSRTPNYVDLDLQQPLWGPRVLVLYGVRRLSEHIVSAWGHLCASKKWYVESPGAGQPLKSSASYGAGGGGDKAGWSAGCFLGIACMGRKKHILGGLLLPQG